MNNLRILIGLDNSEMDRYLLAYLEQLAKIVSIEQVYLMHVARNLYVPEEIQEKYPLLVAPKDETLKKEISFYAKKHLSEALQEKVIVEVKEGNPAKELLHWSKVKEVDLLMMGRKKKESGSGALATKMVNVSNCSVLLVPEKQVQKPTTVYVAFDFSEVSQLALKSGLSLIEERDGKLICHHIYHVPTGYHTTGKSHEEFAEIMRNNAKEKQKKMQEQMQIDTSKVQFEYTHQDEDATAHEIAQLASERNADIAIIGSKGRTAAASVLLGSVAEKTIEGLQDIPVLIVKKHGENMGFLDALLQL